jgi:flagellar capping protein FliD
MGQIFYSCAYDIETKTCCVYAADKFHANCYAHSGSVFSVHYLLRQKPYNVMWGGHYVVLDDLVQEFLRPQDLLGLSTYLTYEDFEMNNEDLINKSYYEAVKSIGENNKIWKKIDVWDKAKEYFDWEKTHSVEYSGYLLNHTKKQAVDLADYYKQSKGLSSLKKDIVIDAVPVLTETGGGTMMALFDGASIETTENLAGTWRGDLLQIVDELPKNYNIINCCFVDMWSRARYCCSAFGIDDKNYILKNNAKERYQGTMYNINQERDLARYIKVSKDENGEKQLVTEFVDNQEAEAYNAKVKKHNIKVAKEMKAKGMSIDIISMMCRLSIDEVKSL